MLIAVFLFRFLLWLSGSTGTLPLETLFSQIRVSLPTRNVVVRSNFRRASVASCIVRARVLSVDPRWVP